MKVFREMKVKEIVTFARMAGCRVQGQGRKELKPFDKMIEMSEVMPNQETFLSLLSACSHGGLLKSG